MRYFVSAGLSPNPSPEVGGAFHRILYILRNKVGEKKKVTTTS
jgi:hypothetical protein